jgi:hypothetical protein
MRNQLGVESMGVGVGVGEECKGEEMNFNRSKFAFWKKKF